MNRGWRFCRFNGVVNRVVSCWSLVYPAPSFWLVLGPYWTTFGLRLPVIGTLRDPAAALPPNLKQVTALTLPATRGDLHRDRVKHRVGARVTALSPNYRRRYMWENRQATVVALPLACVPLPLDQPQVNPLGCAARIRRSLRLRRYSLRLWGGPFRCASSPRRMA